MLEVALDVGGECKSLGGVEALSSLPAFTGRVSEDHTANLSWKPAMLLLEGPGLGSVVLLERQQRSHAAFQ